MKIITFLHRLLFVVIVTFSVQTFSQNLLVNGGFESGGAGVGFQTNYNLPATIGNSGPRDYNIISDPFTMNTANFAHATDYPTGTGKMMVVDGSGTGGDKVWELLNGSSIGVVSGRTYEFTYYIRSISARNDLSNSAIIDVSTNGTTTIPQLMSGPSICPIGNPSVWTKVVYRWMATTNNAQIWLVDNQTFGGGVGNDFAIDNLSLVDVASICQTPVASVTQQPTCLVPTGTVVFTSPLNLSPAPLPPSDLFISEVTDSNAGSLTYVEIYNGTGVTKNLTNYKLKFYTTVAGAPACDLLLSGLIAHNSVVVIAVGSVVNQGSVSPDLVFAGCGGVNNNDNIRLTSATDVEIDLWGRTDGVPFTPVNQPGYTYRRLANAPKPSTAWNPADWTALDPEDYSDVGNYLMTVYEYSLNSTTYQSSPTFTGLPPNTTYNNATIRDLITGCVSVPISLTINPIAAGSPPAVLGVTYCPNDPAVPLTAIPSAGGTLNWYGTNASGGSASATAPTPLTTGVPGSIVHYYVSQTVGGCESTRADLPVFIGRVPLTGQAPSLLCDGPGTTDTQVSFDFNNVAWFAGPPQAIYQTSWSYTYSIEGGPLVSGIHTGASSFAVPVTAPGQSVTFSVTWNGLCGVPTLTRTCRADCLVTPVLSIHNPNAVCSGTVDITLPAVTNGSTGGGTLSYWADSGATTPLSFPANAIPTAGTYYIKSSLGACYDIESVVVTFATIPATPTLNSTAPTCSANGSTTITNYIAANTYTFSPTGPTVGAGGLISGAVIGTPYTVTSSNATCTSAVSASFTNQAQLSTPAIPTVSTTAPTCTANGSTTITNYNASNTYTFTPAGPTVGAGGIITGAVIGTPYTVKATSGTCTSLASLSFTNLLQLATPAVPTVSTTAPTCTANGSTTITNYNAANTYSFTPAGPTAGAGGTITGAVIGTAYTVKATTTGCVSAASLQFTNLTQLPTPAVPTVSTTAPTCTANGSTTITNYNAANTYSFTPAGPTVGAGGTITGAVVGTPYTVKATSGTCTSLASLSFTNLLQLATPAVPTVSTAAPTCTANGSTTITNYNAANTYSFTPAGPTAGAGGTITGAVIGTAYTVKATTTGCVSAASLQFTNLTQLPTPAVPTVSTTAPTCTANGSTTITNYNAANTYSFIPAGPTVGAGGTITGAVVGTPYTVKATSGTCTSLGSLSFTNQAQLPTPSVPTVSTTAPTCTANGFTTITNFNAANTYAFTPIGPTVGVGGTISGAAVGTAYTVKSTNGGCVSAASLQFTNLTQLPIPAVPTVSTTAPTCLVNGFTTITNYNAANTYGFTPAGPTVGAGGAITGAVIGTAYTVKATRGTCTSAASLSFTNQTIITPATPTLSTTAPTCTANGFTTITNYNAANTYAFTPAGPTAGSGGTITGAALGTAYTVTATNSGCTSANSLQFNNLSTLPGLVIPTLQPLKNCDPNTDGLTTFDLTQIINTITGGSSSYTVTFHETNDDATANGTTIPNPSSYTTIVPRTQTIYIRVTSNITSCYQIVPFQLISNLTPLPNPTVPDFALCDVSGAPNQEIFNLSSWIPQISTQAGVTIRFYGSLPDAQANVPSTALSNLFPNTSNPQQIWFNIQDNVTLCNTTGSFNLVVNPLPTVPPLAYPAYSLCDDDQSNIGYEVFDLGGKINSILSGQLGMDVQFYDSYPDAQNANAANEITPSRYPNLKYKNQIQYVQTIGIRITNRLTRCYAVSSMDLRVEPLPTPTPLTTPYTICDSDQDGLTCGFNLSSLVPDILQGANYTLSFYETLTDAQTGNTVTVINTSVPYCNSVRYIQTLYVRAVDNVTGCWSIMPIEIHADPSPIAPIVPLRNLTICDTDSNSQDGRTIVNLTQYETAILALQPQAASNYTISYYHLQIDAQTNTSLQIIPASSYLATDGDIIWVRVENNNTHCFNVIGSFQLIINKPLALITPTPLNICDDDAPNVNDQYHVFNLILKDSEISGGLGTVTYYPSLALATAGVVGTEISTPTAYTNEPAHPAVQTLGVVVTTPAGCQSITTLDIRVLPVPTPRTPPVLTKCDDVTPNGTELFDLTVNESYIANGDLNLTFHYFPTRADAESNNTLVEFSPANAVEVGSNVFIRVENTRVDYQGNHCYVVIEQAIKVNPLPTVVQPLDPFKACDDNTDGIAVFNLADPKLKERILGTTQLPADYTVSFYVSPTEANPLTNTGVAALPMSYTNTFSPYTDQVYIRVENNTTHCVNADGILALVVEDYATATSPTIAPICDNFNDTADGIASIDLDTYAAAVLGGQSATTFLLTYYLSDPTTIPSPSPLSAFEISNHITQPFTDTVWVKVENSSNLYPPKCFAVAQLHFTILARPQPEINRNNPDVHTICVDYNTNTVIRDLTLDSGMVPASNYTYEWFETADPTTILGTSSTYPVPAPFATPSVPRNYVVRVTSIATGCDGESPVFDVIQSGPAALPAGSPGYIVTNPFSDLQVITVNIVGFGQNYQYSLDDGPRQDSNVFENVPIIPNPHTIHVWDNTDGVANSCEEFIIKEIEIIDYPHYFTPNGDGIHDAWNVTGLSQQKGVVIYIFDRYGKLLKQISSDGPGWDGTFNGHLLPADDYWFTVDFLEPTTSISRQFRAHFTLKR